MLEIVFFQSLICVCERPHIVWYESKMLYCLAPQGCAILLFNSSSQCCFIVVMIWLLTVYYSLRMIDWFIDWYHVTCSICLFMQRKLEMFKITFSLFVMFNAVRYCSIPLVYTQTRLDQWCAQLLIFINSHKTHTGIQKYSMKLYSYRSLINLNWPI